MTTTLKSYGLSITLHAGVLGLLCVVPSATERRFSPVGQTQVISIEASQAGDAAAAVVPVVLTDVSAPIESDDAVDRRLSDPLDVEHEPTRLPSPSFAAEVEVAERMMMRRRELVTETPTIADISKPQPIHPTQRSQSTPAFAAKPVTEIVGVKEKESADLTNSPPPTYPRQAVRERMEGSVLLRLHIAANGKVDEVVVVQSSGYTLLDQAAVKAVSRWSGTPAKRWGRPVDSTELLPLRFTLE